MSKVIGPCIFISFVVISGAVVLLMHCISIGKWHFLSPIRKSNRTPDEEATIAVPAEQTPLLRRQSSKNSIASNRSARTIDPWRNFLPECCIFDRWTEPRSATCLGLPSKPHPGLEILESISILDSCEDCSPCPAIPPALRLYAFTNTPFIGTPGLCFTTAEQWYRTARWVRGGNKRVNIPFRTWEGRKMVARVGLAEDGNIEVMGLNDIITAMGKGKDRA